MQEKTADKIRGYIFTPKEARMLFCFHQNRQKSLIFIISGIFTPKSSRKSRYIKPFLIFFYFFCLIRVCYK